jgi:hypothetical protein
MQLYSFMTSALDGGGWSTSRPGRLYPWERPGTHFTGGWLGPRVGLDMCGKISPPPGFDPRTFQPVASRYTDYAIPAHKTYRKAYLSFYLNTTKNARNSDLYTINKTGHVGKT